jgi:hypothetical protein
MRPRLPLPLVLLLIGAFTACSDPPVDPPDSVGPGALWVSVTTTGLGHDPDGYTVDPGRGYARAVTPNDTVVIADVPAGNRGVTLTGVAGNCSVVDDNRRLVSVPTNDTVSVHFAVSCAADLFTALIVSNPVPSPDLAHGVVYVALSPRPIDLDAQGYVITTRRTGAAARATLVNGGFDPVTVTAAAGDTLDLRFMPVDGADVRQFFAVVPARRPPVVVRSVPRAQDWVSLDAAPLVMFSEPIDPATLVGLSVERSPNAPVAGAAAFDDLAHLRVRFTPAESLAVGVAHTLRVTRAITDLDGDTLETAVTIEFWTQDPAAWDDSPPALRRVRIDPADRAGLKRGTARPNLGLRSPAPRARPAASHGRGNGASLPT